MQGRRLAPWLLAAALAVVVGVARVSGGRTAAGFVAGGLGGPSPSRRAPTGMRSSRQPSSSPAPAAPAPAAAPRRQRSCSGGGRGGAVSRREAWRTAGLWSLAVGAGAVGLGGNPAASRAADEPAAAAAAPKVWISGKGAQPKGSKDRTGTKKDSGYLRCLSDCTTECRKPGQGPSKDSQECLELCQDYCCQTYEQCTYVLQPE